MSEPSQKTYPTRIIPKRPVLPREAVRPDLKPGIQQDNVMLKIDGVTQRCPECGANVFHRDGRPNVYICNGCETVYIGEK